MRDDWKMLKKIQEIMKNLFFLLMGAQIVLGIGWIAANIAHIPLFQETVLLMDAAESLVADEYMGILYPLLIKAARWIEMTVHIPSSILLYTLQMMAAVFSAVYVLRYSGWICGSGLCRIVKYGFVAGYLVTFPLLLQMHLAVLPHSFAASIAVILVCDGLYYLRHAEKIKGSILIRLCGLWMLDVLLVPDYSWTMGVFVVAILCVYMFKNKEWRTRILVCILSTVLCFGVIGQTTQVSGSRGRIQKSVESCLMLRFVWPNLVSYNYFWPDEIRETFSAGELAGITKYFEGMVFEFGPVLEEKYGKEEANELYLDMAVAALGLNTKQIAMDIGRDFASYLCPQAAFQQQKAANRSSLMAWNYGRLQERAPMLTKYYVNISFAGWNVMIVLSLLLIGGKRRSKIRLCPLLIVGSGILFAAFWYTMQGAGIQDYKKVMLISLLWLLPIIRGYTLTEECE